MVKIEEQIKCKKEYTVPQMEVLAFEAQGALLENSGGDVYACTEGVNCD